MALEEARAMVVPAVQVAKVGVTVAAVDSVVVERVAVRVCLSHRW